MKALSNHLHANSSSPINIAFDWVKCKFQWVKIRNRFKEVFINFFINVLLSILIKSKQHQLFH